MTGHPLAVATIPDPEGMEQLGARVAPLLGEGDTVCLAGPLGAGKTTFTRGLAAGLGVRGDVASPTFVIARRHPGPRVDLLHCDAYRVGSADEFADLDLDPAGAVVVVEWGQSVMAELSDSWLEIVIERSSGTDEEQRRVAVSGHGPRWSGTREQRVRTAVTEGQA